MTGSSVKVKLYQQAQRITLNEIELDYDIGISFKGREVGCYFTN